MSRPHGSAKELERRRYWAIEAVQQGDLVEDVARIYGVTESSVYRWLRMAKEPDGLAAKPHLGPEPRLSPEQQQELETLLLQGADAHGWPTHLWTTQRIADLVRTHFGV